MTTNICSAFLATVARRGDQVAIRSKTKGAWNSLTWNELASRVATFAAGLQAQGVQPGDRVTLMLPNSPEFYVADLAVLFCGATPISLYTSSSPEQVSDLCQRANARLLIDEATMGTISGDPIDLRAAADSVVMSDLATVIFTSGTTSVPKGVLLTHANVAALVEGVRAATGVDLDGKRVLSYLPLAHIAERALSYYLPIYEGMEVTTCPDVAKLAIYLPATRPHLFFGVPRVWEKLHAGAERSLAAKPLVHFAVKALIVGGPITRKLGQPLFRKIRVKLGLDEAILVASGAAPMAPHIGEWFSAIGLPFSEIFGMSETCGPLTWSPHHHRSGTVGKPMPGTEVALLPDGEVIARGPSISIGYLNDPDATAATIQDGWLYTGDIGEFDYAGNLRIIDRKKDLIINGGGKNISPAAIESRLSALPEIGHVCVLGDRRPYLTAVIAIDAAVADTAESRQAIAHHIATVNASISQPERIKKFLVVSDEWTVNSDLLTATMKVKRRGVEARYSAEIEALYLGAKASSTAA